MKYLARYTHKTAISNRRLLSLEDGQVTFRWKDYAQGARQRTMTLDAIEFVRRFLMHVFPSGFVRIRHYGIDVGHRFAARLDRRHEVEHVPTDGRGDVALQVFLGLVLGILLELVDDILVDRGSTAERDEVVAVDAQLQGALVPVDGRPRGSWDRLPGPRCGAPTRCPDRRSRRSRSGCRVRWPCSPYPLEFLRWMRFAWAIPGPASSAPCRACGCTYRRGCHCRIP